MSCQKQNVTGYAIIRTQKTGDLPNVQQIHVQICTGHEIRFLHITTKIENDITRKQDDTGPMRYVPKHRIQLIKSIYTQ